MLHSTVIHAIDQQATKLAAASRHIWENPEVAFQEYEASGCLASILRESGFEVEVGAFGIPTAIRATYGSGHPVIGFLGEYDALPGLSQKAVSHQEPAVPGGSGHGCGHNLLGVAHLGAALGLQAYLMENNLPGTIVFYGCPAEELITGKVFMARAGAFRELDLAMGWHPGPANIVSSGVCSGMNTVKFHFTGRTSHAAADPQSGRSALDALELMNIGANFLREHVTSDVRIHYSVSCPSVPNVVPDKATGWYFVRALKRETVDQVYQRLIKVAKGAAMMTETEVEVELLGGCHPTMNNKVLIQEVHRSIQEVPAIEYTEEELAFATELNRTTPDQWEQDCKKFNLPPETPIFNGVLPVLPMNNYASTDVGDVAHIVPTIAFFTTTSNLSAPGHSWQNCACSGHSIGEKGMIFAAKVMANAAAAFVDNQELVAEAKKQFELDMDGKDYVCPIPDDIPVPIK